VTSESFRLCPPPALGPCWVNLPLRSLLSLLSLLLPPPLLLSLESLLLSRGSLGACCGLIFESRLRGRTVWLSQGVGVGVWFERVDWSLADTDRTILLSFSKRKFRISYLVWEHEPPLNFLPISNTLPPLLVSRPNGALQVGQYCDSNSLMYS
jgi:hypothetical protein